MPFKGMGCTDPGLPEPPGKAAVGSDAVMVMENVLVVAAHPDDELLGVGGTIRKLTEQGACCRAVIVGEGISSRAASRKDADPYEMDRLKEDARKAADIVGYASIDFGSLPDNRLDGMELLDRMRCYQSENAAFPHPRSAEALCALAAFRGSNIGVGRAEAFMALREVYR